MALHRERKQFNSDSFIYIVEVDFQLQSFENYIKITEEVIEKEIKRELEAYEKLFHESPDHEQLDYDLYDHEIRLNTQKLYYNSLFVSLYSFLERKLYQFCDLAQTHHIIKIKDLSDEGVFKYHKYLKKVVGINFDKLNTEWSEIGKYNKLRNILVHQPTTEIENTESHQKQITTLKSIKHLTCKDYGDKVEFFITEKDLLLDFIKIVRKFLHEIYYEKVDLS